MPIPVPTPTRPTRRATAATSGSGGGGGGGSGGGSGGSFSGSGSFTGSGSGSFGVRRLEVQGQQKHAQTQIPAASEAAPASLASETSSGIPQQPSSKIQLPRAAGLGVGPSRIGIGFGGGRGVHGTSPTTAPAPATHEQVTQLQVEESAGLVQAGGSQSLMDADVVREGRENASRDEDGGEAGDEGDDADGDDEEDGEEDEMDVDRPEGEVEEMRAENGAGRSMKFGGDMGGSSGFFGSMEMDDAGEETEADAELDPEMDADVEREGITEGEQVTDDGGIALEVEGKAKMLVETPSPQSSMTDAGKSSPPAAAAGGTRKRTPKGSEREKVKREKEERDRAKMPPPPTKRVSKPATDKSQTGTATAASVGSKGTAAPSPAGGLGRSKSVRTAISTKDSGSVRTRPRGTTDSKPVVTKATTSAAPSSSTTRHMRARSIAGQPPGASAASTFSRSSASAANSANANTTGTDSEGAASNKRAAAAAARTGAAKKSRPASMFVATSKPAAADKDADAAPPSPTTATAPNARTRPQSQSKETAPSVNRRPSAKALAGPTLPGGQPSVSTHRRMQSESQSSQSQSLHPSHAAEKPSRPAFNTLQKDYSAPTAPPSTASTQPSTTSLLPDAPTLQKQTHLLQLVLLHNTAITSFQSFHASARQKLEARYNHVAALHNEVRSRMIAKARAADLAVLGKILQTPPAPPPAGGGVARFGTAAGRRLSLSAGSKPSGNARRKTLSGAIATPVEEMIQVFSESTKRLDSLLRKGGEVARVRGQWESWVSKYTSASSSDSQSSSASALGEGLPKQWHRDFAAVLRKVEAAVDGVREFWWGYQGILVGGVEGGEPGMLGKMVMGYLELGEEVVKELEEIKTLERAVVEEGRERMRMVVRKVIEGGEGMEVGGDEKAGSGGYGVWKL
ncbi:hypothetical protein BDZ91DRAFT_716390 [Kalaharituber pfeilii]|nr:hypothetical protein BDZ91DRAFT_716390 [Kalaharituber pfeilii]